MEMMSESNSDASSISLSSTKSTRDELSEALEKIRLSKETLSETKTSSSSRSQKSTPTDSDVKLQDKVVRLVKRETDRASTNIVMHVKYYSSPLRLMLKSQCMMLPLEQKVAYASALKMADFIKNDIISEWNAKDFFGLKILIKMYRLYKMVFPMLGSHDQFLEHFEPKNLGNEPHKDTIYYLYNYVMNPGYGFYAQGNAVPLEHEVHMWLNTFLADREELIKEVEFELADFQNELVKKTAFQLNVMASTIFQKPISFKHFDSSNDIPKKLHKVTINAEETMYQLYNLYIANEPIKILGEQMMLWMNQDDLMQGQAPRVILGGKRAKKNKRGARK